MAESFKVLVSCSSKKSSDALLETLATADAHEFRFDVVMAHRPCFAHHPSSSVDSSRMSRGVSPSASRALNLAPYNIKIATTSLLPVFFGANTRLARQGSDYEAGDASHPVLTHGGAAVKGN